MQMPTEKMDFVNPSVLLHWNPAYESKTQSNIQPLEECDEDEKFETLKYSDCLANKCQWFLYTDKS